MALRAASAALRKRRMFRLPFVRGLIAAGALAETRAAGIRTLHRAGPGFQVHDRLNLEQEAAARTLRGAVASERFLPPCWMA